MEESLIKTEKTNFCFSILLYILGYQEHDIEETIIKKKTDESNIMTVTNNQELNLNREQPETPS